jgi:8-oxo-dGTP diphosphatase
VKQPGRKDVDVMTDTQRQPGRITVGVILVSDAGEVLMQLRDDIPTIADPGCWVNPGGVLDPGEDPEAGARRELLEETGYTVAELAFGYQRDLIRPSGEVERQYYYLGRYDGVQTVECYEGQALHFVSPAELPTMKTSPDLASIILDILDRVSVPGSDQVSADR